MGNKIIKNIINTVIYIFAFAMTLIVISLPFQIYQEIVVKFNEGSLEAVHFVVGAINSVYCVGYLVVIIMLIKIINTTKGTPFIMKNIKRFRIMGIFLTINTVFECIKGYSSNKAGMIVIMGTEYGGISPLMIIGLVSALMCFVMAEVFKKAVEIKNDNDLTI